MELPRRPVRYLRVSVTDRCDLRCPYCVPRLPPPRAPRDEVLTHEEIVTVIRAAAAAGIRKVRLTGGEPLGRRGVDSLILALSRLEWGLDLGLTTNGLRLRDFVPLLARAGFRRLNVHLDSLDPGRYVAVTGGAADGPAVVVAGIDAALAAGLRVKLNAVCSPGMTVDDALRLARFGLDRGIDVRFIEEMPVVDAPVDPIAADVVRDVESGVVAALGLVFDAREGVARMYRARGACGRVGFITPSRDRFCDACDKLRLSSLGVLRTCLFAPEGVRLLPIVRRGDSEALTAAIEGAIARKGASRGREGRAVATMVGIGG